MTNGGKAAKGGRGGEARAVRLKAALRENLRRRKAQAKERKQAGASHDSAGIVPDKSGK